MAKRKVVDLTACSVNCSPPLKPVDAGKVLAELMATNRPKHVAPTVAHQTLDACVGCVRQRRRTRSDPAVTHGPHDLILATAWAGQIGGCAHHGVNALQGDRELWVIRSRPTSNVNSTKIKPWSVASDALAC